MKNDWYRRLRTVLLAGVLLSSLFTASCNFTWNQPNEDTPTILPIYVLSVNDLHGYIMRDKEGRNGLSNMAYLINQIRDADDYDNVILIGNGDMFQGTYISNETNGLAVIDAMNAMKFDAMGIGNHEFDWGIDVILKYFDGDPNNGEANFPLLNANIYVKASNSLLTVKDGKVFESYIVEREGIKIGLISYIGDLYNSIIYSMVKDYEFDLNLSDSIERIGRSLKQAGADIIVVNIHYGDEYNKIFAQAKDEQGNYLVDAVINGHEHKRVQDVVERDGGIPMPYVQAGSNGKYIGKITLYFNTKTRSVIDYDVE
ncbi:MAG TPA: metallophosphatase, partial [Haloplasmataceae bacterium]